MALFTSVVIGRAIVLVLVYRLSIEIRAITKAEEGLPTSDFKLHFKSVSLVLTLTAVTVRSCNTYPNREGKYSNLLNGRFLVVRSGLDSVVPLCHFFTITLWNLLWFNGPDSMQDFR